MLLRRTWAIAHKELRHIGRNRLTLFLVTLSPAMLLFLLAYVFAFNVDRADLAVLDFSRSQAARDYLSRIAASGALRLAAEAASYPEIDRLLVAGIVDAALVIPPDFERSLAGQASAPVQLIVDGSNPIIASQITSMINHASAMASASQGARAGAAPAFQVRSRIWYNDSLNSQVSMVPGLLVIVLSLPALALTLSLTREKELGTLEGLMATPLEGIAYLTGKMSAYIVTGLLGFLLGWLVAVAWFQVPFRGEMSLLVVSTVAYFLATMGISLLIASRIASQQTAMLLAMLIFFVPSFFLAGLIDPIDPQSAVAVALSTPLPATHYIAITRGIFLKGVGLETLSRPISLLLLMGLSALLISTLLFKKKLA
jgi:ABC-type multidrug transport system permease subunit